MFRLTILTPTTILALLSSLGVVIILAGIVAVIVLERRRRRVSDLPTCGHCRYVVRGIASLTCPECGSDLREVGIFVPGMRRGPNTTLRVGIFTVAFPIAALLLTQATYEYGPQRFTEESMRNIYCQVPDAPYLLPPYVAVRAQGSLVIWWGDVNRAPPQKLTLTISHPVTSEMHVNLDSGIARFFRPSDSASDKPRAFNEQAVTEWFDAVGVDVDDPRVIACIPAIVQAARETPEAPTTFSRLAPDPQTGKERITAHPAQTWGSSRPVLRTWGQGFGMIYLWAGLWLVGVFLILRHARPPRRPPSAAA
jgi:hypothetical protein